MDPDALARSNHLFFCVDLTQRGLLTETFKMLCRRGAGEALYAQNYPKLASVNDGIQQLPFKCQNGEFGYLRFTGATARALVDGQIDALSLAIEIPRFIQGELHDRCEFTLGNETRVLFKIIEYEGNLGSGCVEIKNPVVDCPADDIPLSRKLEMIVATEIKTETNAPDWQSSRPVRKGGPHDDYFKNRYRKL